MIDDLLDFAIDILERDVKAGRYREFTIDQLKHEPSYVFCVKQDKYNEGWQVIKARTRMMVGERFKNLFVALPNKIRLQGRFRLPPHENVAKNFSKNHNFLIK